MTGLEKSIAPWTPDEVESLNEYQRSGAGHPFTCGQCRDVRGTTYMYTDEGNGSLIQLTFEMEMGMSLAERHALFDSGRLVHRERELVATLGGWICPTCDYTQDWAHAHMANGAWRGHMNLMNRVFGR
jgi:hypothetical protein